MEEKKKDDPLAGSIAMEKTDQEGTREEMLDTMEEDPKESDEKPMRYTHELRVVFKQRRNTTSRQSKKQTSVFDAPSALKSLIQAFFTIKDVSVHGGNKVFSQIKQFPKNEKEFQDFFDCTPNGQTGNMEVYFKVSTELKFKEMKADSELYDYIMTNNVFVYLYGYTKQHEMRAIDIILFKHPMWTF
jgi:hypothetical protein